ncbi:hypothetical protein [Plantactinospora sp. GCM10030261]|uniref:hypothetical protein n=1 Tax=Plantactinospora sp. GCM10030261 TaxID=3273420 RepID=UPI00360AD4FB
MPSPSTRPQLAPGSVAKSLVQALAGAVSATLLVSGCQTLDDAGRVLSRSELVNDLAARLESATQLTYSADYQLADGATGSIAQAQEPRRASYSYPGGKIMMNAEATARCSTANAPATCTLEPPPAPGTRPPLTSVSAASQAGLVTPPVVIALLTDTALDQEAVVEQEDTTVAGRHATCVQVSEAANAAASSFYACVTDDGILGSFRGSLDGKEVDTALTRYRDAVDGTAFDMPEGAGVVDRRTARD